MNVEGKKVLVVGTGKSGIAAAALLAKEKAAPVLFDENKDTDAEEVKKKLPDAEIEVITGTLPEGILDELELAVLSPGVPVDTPFVEKFRDKGIPVWGEVELGYAFSKGKVIAITGTNGKTTTTALTGQIMRDYYESVFVVGNIGNPYTLEALNTREDSVTVAEISSFQLETTVDFHPSVSAVLNITPDHLNRHHTMENYAAVKESITKNQTKEDTCVLNYEDPYTRAFGERCPASVIWFSSADKLAEGYYLEGEDIIRSFGGVTEKLLNINEMKLIGTHNVENVMAAIAMSAAYGVPMANIINTVKHFQAVEHRIEYVAEKDGVVYYNDSKGTNPDAAIQALRAMPGPTLLIAGGYDKNSEYDDWVSEFEGKVRYLVLIGQTRDKIAECAKKHGFTEIMYAEDMQEAVQVCAVYADIGDYVLLSPACASWGMFKDYEERGRVFKECVMAL